VEDLVGVIGSTRYIGIEALAGVEGLQGTLE